MLFFEYLFNTGQYLNILILAIISILVNVIVIFVIYWNIRTAAMLFQQSAANDRITE